MLQTAPTKEGVGKDWNKNGALTVLQPSDEFGMTLNYSQIPF